MRSVGKEVIVCINSKRKRCHRSEKKERGYTWDVKGREWKEG